MNLRLIALLAGATLCGCQTAPHAPLPTAKAVDLQRYAGRWYEVARLPNPFQRPEERAMADYSLLPDARVQVVNTAIAPDGRQRAARGQAEVVAGSNNARLRVKFEGLASLAPVPAEGNYWIIELDRQRYRYVMVGTPSRKFLWILSRTPTLDGTTRKRLESRAQALGFPVSNLIQAPAR